MKTKAKLVNRQSTVLLPERDIDKSPVLECVGLGVTFGGLKAVEDFNLTIGRTEIAGLIGPNGAGKTTVFNLLTKVYQPTAGAIVLDGKDTHSMTTAQVNKAGIARTFQNIRLFGDLTVVENLMVAMNDSMRYGLVGSILHFPRFAREDHIAREEHIAREHRRRAAGQRHHPQGLSGRINRQKKKYLRCFFFCRVHIAHHQLLPISRALALPCYYI